MRLKDLPKAAWMAIVRWTAILTLGSVAISVVASTVIMSTLSRGLNAPGFGVAVLMPVVIGVPICFWHLVRVQQLKLANQKLQVLASTDWLTACLNRRAFTDRVTRQLEAGGAPAAGGALLIIDADHFKAVNDRYGHHSGDEALQLMAEVIRAKVRTGDLVCRMGGEEFGVFLDGADGDTASLISERIRHGIQAAHFAPRGEDHPLTVSIGGIAFDGATASFTELFRLADQNLYMAKQSGRNCTIISPAVGHERPAAAAGTLRLAGAG